ncbi:hypothetical protein MPNT_130038 [Candidatus Methylacidithermus pantelleriae]|uniref:Uncharacterized protein n=1 Tax=Candidatus Methylacidithermus pantelleriae TaxID=2744239 RepID=A0A8J2FRQ3_9BACT|nr:hypothetical protein MPNT_130038 [Candidatus Methylacidithermus pantelleriae]
MVCRRLGIHLAGLISKRNPLRPGVTEILKERKKVVKGARPPSSIFQRARVHQARSDENLTDFIALSCF